MIFFILGIITMDYPFITIFNKPTELFGMPMLFLYLNIGWLISIFVIYLYTKAIDGKEEEERGGKRR